jgi:ribosome-binding factor A
MSKGGFMRRVDEQMRHVVAEEVARLKDPGLGFVTVTGVDTSPDLRHARVYYSVLGDAEQRASTAAALARASGRVRAAVGERVRLKYLPKIDFEFDESVDRGIKMDELLRDLGSDDETEHRGTTSTSD